MVRGLLPVTNALAELTDRELQALIDATGVAPKTAPWLLAWMEAACDWELNRRAGHHDQLQPPEVTIPPEEDATSIDVTMAMRATFAEGTPPVQAFFDSVVGLLTGGERRAH